MSYGVTQTLRILLDVNCVLNAASSLIIISLIHRLRLMLRGYVLLIYSMTVCQFVFDAALILLFECKQGDMDCLNSCFFLASTFGIASQGWSVFIAIIVAYIIASRRRFNIDKYYWMMMLAIVVCSVTVGTIRVLASVNANNPSFPLTIKESIYLYDAMRYLEIIVNLIALGLIFSHLRGMHLHELDNNPIYVLAKKLLLYPAVQLLSRIGSTQYEDIYGISFPQDSQGWSTQSIQAVLYAVLTPLGGFLSLLIFLCVQPGAWRLTVQTLSPYCICCCIGDKNELGPEDAACLSYHSSGALQEEPAGGKYEDYEGEGEGGVVVYDDASPMHERSIGNSSSAASFAVLSSLHGSRAGLGGLVLSGQSGSAAVSNNNSPTYNTTVENSLSTVFSAQRSSLHTPRKLADLSEEQLVEVIASQAQSEAAAGGGGVFKSASHNDLQSPFLN